MDQNELLQNYTLLSSLKNNINKSHHYTHEKYVEEYHQILDGMEKSGINLEKFKIPEKELKNMMSSFNYITGQKTYRNYKEIETSFFLTKLEALLNYFSLISQSPKPQIGFNDN